MPIKVKDSLPARSVLEKENIFVMTEYFALHQDIRPLKVLVMNLMPTKIVTETQILRKLSNTPLQIEVDFLQTASYRPQHIDQSHLDSFYRTFDEVKSEKYDGLIIPGAPLDFVDYEDVDYWDELCEIFEWSRTHVHCSLFLCWGAFAALYYFYNIPKRDHVPKLHGIYEHEILKKTSPLFRGMDDRFFAPHSRVTDVDPEEIKKVPQLELMAVSDKAGVAVAKTVNSRQFFLMCHLEYDADTLALEYERDKNKGMNPELPYNYFPDDDPSKPPVVRWRSAGQLIFSNWLNYYVYQTTPYDVRDI